jgi:triphosphoribosyl-dephospho-CoA synthase
MCLELSVLFESSTEKPGNVNKQAHFGVTRYEHFLASAVAISPLLEQAAKRGIEVSQEKISLNNIRLGEIIKNCVLSIDRWQHGGNTLLGTAILLSPIAVAAGMTPIDETVFDFKTLRRHIKVVVEATTPEDAVQVYEAIRLARPGGLGSSSQLDVNNPNSTTRILKDRISLYQAFKIASDYDSICSEWVNNYPITFDLAYPYSMKQLNGNADLNTAVVNTFLKVLAEHPDTLITRKTDAATAQEISLMARNILNAGGIETTLGKKELEKFDARLRRDGNLLNPGTTADIISAALALCVLGGYRP